MSGFAVNLVAEPAAESGGDDRRASGINEVPAGRRNPGPAFQPNQLPGFDCGCHEAGDGFFLN